jgi:hypothetical protein
VHFLYSLSGGIGGDVWSWEVTLSAEAGVVVVLSGRAVVSSGSCSNITLCCGEGGSESTSVAGSGRRGSSSFADSQSHDL